MTAGWVAPVQRGRSLLARTLGPSGAATIAAADGWEDARRLLAPTVYGRHLAVDADRRAARITAESATAWQIRVLAGWLPPGGAVLARLAVAPFEIANIDRHLLHLEGGDPAPPIDLGTLGVAWPRVAVTDGPAAVRAVLRRSSWGDPGGDDRPTIVLGLRVSWGRRSMAVDPIVRPWAMGALALVVARERFVFDRPIPAITARSVDRALGPGWRRARDLEELVRHLPEPARWSLLDLDEPGALWRSELAVLARVAHDAAEVAAKQRPSRSTVVAILALLLVDAWRATAAIEAAGGGPVGGEVLDAVGS